MQNSPKPAGGPDQPGRFKLFVPMLAGATLRERMIACVGAVIGICLTGALCALIVGQDPYLPLIVAPVGASSVLLFAVPASPLAQPWSIIGGNSISALVGVAVAHWIHDPVLATGVAVGLAIAAMSFTRSLHPPGGAAALTGVLGGKVVESWGWLFPLVPMALNCIVLVAFGIAFHRLFRRSYPHVPAPAPVGTHKTSDLPPQLRVGFSTEDVDAALAALDETFDIDRDDLDRLLRQVELQSLIRSHGALRSDEIMSRDVIKIDRNAEVDEARALLLDHNIRTLPVVDAQGVLVGSVGLRELAQAKGRFIDAVSEAATAAPDDLALSLLPKLTDGRSHAVVIVDAERHVIGLITQTDLLASLAHSRPQEA